MAEKDNNPHVKRSKAEPTFLDSPIKSKAGINSSMNMILKKLLDVHDLAKSTNTNTDSMQIELTAIRADINNINNRISETEQRISDLEDTKIITDKELLLLHASMRKTIADLEDRNRRGNLRIFGLPEDSESKEDSLHQCISFLETWIPKITGLQCDEKTELEIAHRVPSFKQHYGPLSKPRPIVCRPLRFRHMESILLYMGKNNHINWNGSRIYISQDYSKTTVGTRKGLLVLRSRLEDMKIQFSFAGPAKFRIIVEGKYKLFDNHNALKSYLDNLTEQEMDVNRSLSNKRKP
ncbi:hypothetical protein NDU88_000904 [Pleurodeles waltl]|uniref:L1 transposable element RRM domain-containing protein n=1 Tax=Pleurodeles waltl TaxID=8319 RepID=A0AAV7VXC7_PLEWA|nr:hypothetical protein NDU88_000904 [Pleurodeles waltl]